MVIRLAGFSIHPENSAGNFFQQQCMTLERMMNDERNAMLKDVQGTDFTEMINLQQDTDSVFPL